MSSSRLLVLTLVLAFSRTSYAGLITYGPYAFAGHSYALVLPDTPGDGLSWINANAAASAMTLGGHSGYLASITSSQENTFLETNFANLLRPTSGQFQGDFAWIGLTDTANEGDYRWNTGEPFSYSNWASTEPNNIGGNEDYVHYWVRNGQFAWNDEDNNDFTGFNGTLQGYFVEFNTTAVPEPSSYMLLAIGSTVLLIRSRRSKKPQLRQA